MVYCITFSTYYVHVNRMPQRNDIHWNYMHEGIRLWKTACTCSKHRAGQHYTCKTKFMETGEASDARE